MNCKNCGKPLNTVPAHTKVKRSKFCERTHCLAERARQKKARNIARKKAELVEDCT